MSAKASPTDSPAKTPVNEKNSVNACLACRKVKMKCVMSSENNICDRCIRKSFHCVFEKHRRGRKPAFRLGHTSLHDSFSTRSTRRRGSALESQSRHSPEPNTHNASVPQFASTGGSAWGVRSRHSLDLGLNQHDTATSQPHHERPQSDFWALLEGFRPSGSLNKQVMSGNLEMENITHTQSHSEVAQRSRDADFVPADDPIRLGIVNSSIAATLFSSFMRDLNPYICQFDPNLHTFGYVQRRSPFLLSAILAAAAKAFNPSVHLALREHTEDMFVKCFRNGKKSAEIIQAIIVLTYWKEPDDTRAWLSIGYVIRMCMELGWHKRSPKSEKELAEMDNIAKLECRSIERTWLLLFVYDRRQVLSLQTGSPSMIPRNDLIESAHTWYDVPISSPSDQMLCALVTLRLIGSEVFDLLNPHRSSYRSTLLDRTDGLMNILLNDIKKWHTRWSSMPEMADNDLYQFFVSFYGTNLRLLFSLFPLHATLTSGLPEELIDKHSLLISYSSAVEMLQLLVQPRYSPLVYFIQDSIHIMTAYSAIFLVKLLLSIPQGIRSEIEAPAIDAVRKASDMFTNHAAPPNSGCGLQARFLQNVLRVFRKAHEPRPSRNGQPSHQHAAAQRDYNGQGALPETNGNDTVQSGVPENPYTVPEGTVAGQDGGGGMAEYDYSFGLQDFAFADDDLWSNLFADAGFNINDGVFLPFDNDQLGSMGPTT